MNLFGFACSALFLLIRFGIAIGSCPDDYEAVGFRCYQEFYDEVTWAEAKFTCENSTAGAHLAYVDDCRIMSYISTYLGTHSVSPKKYWIGATDEATEGTWVWTDDASTEVSLGVPFWGTSRPGWVPEPNGDTDENCASISENDQYYLHDEDCESTLYPLCEVDPVAIETNLEEAPTNDVNPTASCPDDYELISGSCFYFHYDKSDDTTLTTYSDANNVCLSKSGKLAVLSDCTVFGAVVQYIEDTGDVQLPQMASYWIGAKDAGDGITPNWIWSSIEPLSTGCPFWGSNNGVEEPNGGNNEKCAMLYRDDRYYIHDGECYKLAYPLCQTTPT